MLLDEITNEYLGFKDQLMRLVKRIIKGSGDVEDILQDAYVKTYNASKEQDIKCPRAFLTHTARNLALNHIKLARVKYNISLEENDNSAVISKDASAEDALDSQRRFRHLCSIISDLPPQCRRAFIYKKVYGMTHKEISAKMNISPKTIEKHISRGLRQCVDYMDLFDKGLSEAELADYQEFKKE